MTVYLFLVKFRGVDILLLIHFHKVWNFQIYIYSVIDLKLALHRSRLFFNVSLHQRKCLPDLIRKYYSTWNGYVLPVIIKEFYRLPHSVKKSNLQVYSVMCSQHKPNYTLFDSQAWVQRTHVLGPSVLPSVRTVGRRERAFCWSAGLSLVLSRCHRPHLGQERRVGERLHQAQVGPWLVCPAWLEDWAEGSLVAAALLPRDSLPTGPLSVGQRPEWGPACQGRWERLGTHSPSRHSLDLKCHLVPLTAFSMLWR